MRPTNELRKIASQLQLKDIFGITVSLLLLFLLFINTPFSFNMLKLEIRDYALFLLSCTIFIFSVLINSYRLKTFLIDIDNSKRNPHTFASVTLGNFFNNILPGNLGELIKLNHLSLRNNLSFKYVLNIWFIEKLVAANIFAFAAVVLFFFYHSVVSWSWLFLVPAMISIIFHLLIFSFTRHTSIEHIVLKLIPFKFIKVFVKYHIRKFTGIYLKQLTKKTMFRFYLLGFVLLTVNSLNHYINLSIGGLPTELVSPENACFFTLLLMMVYFVPAAPSSIGVFQYSIYSSLIVLATAKGIHVNDEMKFKFLFSSFIFYFTFLLPEIVFGVVYLFRERALLFKIRTKINKPSK